MKATNDKPNEIDIISKSKLGHLYNHEFEKGRFFQVVFEDEHETHIQIAPRTMIKIVYIADKKDIEGIEIVKLINKDELQRVKLSKFNISQLKVFLQFISEIDLKGITERRIKLESDLELDDESIKKIKTLLSGNNGQSLIKQLIYEGIVTDEDIVNTGYRKIQFEIFKKLLEDQNYWQEYKEIESITENKEEKIWQIFFKKNPWIFGYGLDYRYKGILQDEFHASDTDADGSNAVITDFLLADKRFTTFVEIKRPSTPLFKGSKNRSRSWKLSNELFESVGQVLEQKASGQIKIENSELYTENGEFIAQKAIDSKVILIIGNFDQEEESAINQQEWAYQSRTFELFRRDSRNIDIITFDELYERAKYIVDSGSAETDYSVEQDYNDLETNDLPF